MLYVGTNIPIQQLSQALFSINRHAKTAPEPQHLYQIKKEAIHKLLNENRAKKIGLHFSDRPSKSNQHSTLLVSVGDYFFHILPEKNDFQELEHLGALDQNYRNPKSKMSLSQAKRIIYRYINWKPKKKSPTRNKTTPSSYFTPSSLGQMEWPPTKPRRHFK